MPAAKLHLLDVNPSPGGGSSDAAQKPDNAKRTPARVRKSRAKRETPASTSATAREAVVTPARAKSNAAVRPKKAATPRPTRPRSGPGRAGADGAGQAPPGRAAANEGEAKGVARVPCVADVMSAPAVCCQATDSLNAAAQLMWEHNLGSVVIVGEAREPLGMLTDRDVCMASYTRGIPLFLGGVTSAMSTGVVSCSVETPLPDVMKLMAARRVRRLPVVDAGGRLVGVVGVMDLVRALRSGASGETSDGSLVDLLACLLIDSADPSSTLQ